MKKNLFILLLILILGLLLTSCEEHVHTWDNGIITTIPTCTAVGYKTFTCLDCGETKSEEIAASGHAWDDGVVTTAPTCTLAGVKICTCTVCNETKAETIPAAHAEVIDAAVAPTCVETGLTEGSHCSVCNLVFVEQTVVPTIEHNYINRVCTSCGQVLLYSEGLAFVSNGNGTCYVEGIGTCGDTDVSIPPTSPAGDSVESIGKNAFYNLTSLTSVTIPSSVTKIDGSAFNDCTSLKYNVYDNANYLGNEENPYFALIEATDTSIASCKIHSNTKVIANSAFNSCFYLKSVTMPNNATSIGMGAFFNCRSLTNITIPKSIMSIGSFAFYNCNSLQSVTIPESITEIEEYTFANCSSFTSVTIPSSVTSIGKGAFGFCTSLASVTIPNSVTSIGEMAFYACSKLTSTTYNDTQAKWNAIRKGSDWNYGTGYFGVIKCTDGSFFSVLYWAR